MDCAVCECSFEIPVANPTRRSRSSTVAVTLQSVRDRVASLAWMTVLSDSKSFSNMLA